MTSKDFFKRLLLSLSILVIILPMIPLGAVTPASAAPSCPTSGAWLGEWDSQGPSSPISLVQGETKTLYVYFKNIGTTTWYNAGSDNVGLFRDDEPGYLNDFDEFEYPNGLGGYYFTRVALLSSTTYQNGDGYFSFQVTAPSNLSLGTYHINLGLAYGGDYSNGGTWIETNSSGNNIDCHSRVWYEIQVTASGEPDLIASQPLPDNSPPFQVGEQIDWSVTLENTGNAVADSNYVAYYLGTSSTDFSNQINTDSVSSLVSGESAVEHDTYTFIAEDIGPRYLNVRADYTNTVNEGNENNNTASYGPFTVQSGLYEAKWLSQTQAGTPDEFFDVTLGQTIDLQVQFQNMQSTEWKNTPGFGQVVLSTYKTATRQSAPTWTGYDDCFNIPADSNCGLSYFHDITWIDDYKATTANESLITQGGTATFQMNLTVPSDGETGKFEEGFALFVNKGMKICY